MSSNSGFIYKRERKSRRKKQEKYTPESGSYSTQILGSIGNQTIQGFFKSLPSQIGFNNAINRDLSQDILKPAENTPAIRQKSPATVQRHVGEFIAPRFGIDVEGTVQMQHAPHRTGIPDRLKSGVERLSGIELNDVRVHYNSDKPANIGALAYTRGTDIYVAPGQEKHLPHEAWHVVQQKQGRVSATRYSGGVPVNDSPQLEHEATRMGLSAMDADLFHDIKEGAGPGTIQVSQANTVCQAYRITEDPDRAEPYMRLQWGLGFPLGFVDLNCGWYCLQSALTSMYPRRDVAGHIMNPRGFRGIYKNYWTHTRWWVALDPINYHGAHRIVDNVPIEDPRNINDWENALRDHGPLLYGAGLTDMYRWAHGRHIPGAHFILITGTRNADDHHEAALEIKDPLRGNAIHHIPLAVIPANNDFSLYRILRPNEIINAHTRDILGLPAPDHP